MTAKAAQRVLPTHNIGTPEPKDTRRTNRLISLEAGEREARHAADGGEDEEERERHEGL